MLVIALLITNTLIAVKASNCPAVDPHQEDVAEASVDHLRLFNKYQDNTKSMSYLPQVSTTTKITKIMAYLPCSW